MKVSLLNPPATRPLLREGRCQGVAEMRQSAIPQISLAYLATALSRVGAEVDLIDAIAEGLALPELLTRLRTRPPGAVFLNTSTPSIAGDMEVAAALKDAFPGCFVVAFGAHVTATHEATLRSSRLDAVIRGEPEVVGAHVVERLMSGRGVGGVGGLTHRDGSDMVVEKEEPPIEDLDALGWPSRDLLPQHLYRHPVSGRPYTTVTISRGCAHRCVYCVAPLFYGRWPRRRSVESVLEELERDVLGRGLDHCWFYADDLLADPVQIRAICEGILARGLKLRWWGNTRADVLDEGLYRLMARAGCVMLSIGGESGDDEVLRRIKKGLAAKDLLQTIPMLRRAGITSLAYFILGLPGETREALRRTVEFAIRGDPDYAEFYPAIPYPGTELHRIAEAGDMIRDSDFSHYASGDPHFPLQASGMSAAELRAELGRAYWRFYSRPSRLLRSVRGARGPAELLRLGFFGARYALRLRGWKKVAAGAP